MERLDYFGRDISIRFKGSKTHKTKCGTIFTLSLFLLILIRVAFLMKDFVHGNNPTVLYQEREVLNPRRFDITPETFSLAFGILGQHYNYIVDSTILTVEAILETKKTVFNETTQQYQDNWNQQPIKMEKCTLDLITSDPTLQSSFVYLDSHYCFSKGQTLYIEGEYNQESFAQIYIFIKRCSGPQCSEESVIQDALKDFYGEVIFTDIYVTPENKPKPFTMYVRDNFWENGLNFPQKVFMEMRNNYINSDFGFFLSDIHTDIFPSFSQNQQSMTQVSNDIYSTFILRFEKKKENLYKRTYLNFLTIMTDLGGMLQVLTTVGIIFTFFLTQTHLNQELINNTFTFKEKQQVEGDKGNVEDCNTKDCIQTRKCGQAINATFSEQLRAQMNTKFLKKSASISQSNNQLFPMTQEKSVQYNDNDGESKNIEKYQTVDSPANRIKQIINEHLPYQKNNQNKGEKAFKEASLSFSKQKEKIDSLNILDKTIIQHSNSMSFNLLDYIKSLFLRFGDYKRKKAIYDYSIKQLYQYLDVQLIINKLIEFDKLKRILLDDNQLQLFEYLPKPSISYSFNKGQVEFHNKESFNTFNTLKQSKNDIDNVRKGMKSFKKLSNKTKQKQVDLRILKYMDVTYKQIFEQESLPSSMIQQQKIKKSQSYDGLESREQTQRVHNQNNNEEKKSQDHFAEEEENVSPVEDILKKHFLQYKQLSLHSSQASQRQNQQKLNKSNENIINSNNNSCIHIQQ